MALIGDLRDAGTAVDRQLIGGGSEPRRSSESERRSRGETRFLSARRSAASEERLAAVGDVAATAAQAPAELLGVPLPRPRGGSGAGCRSWCARPIRKKSGGRLKRSCGCSTTRSGNWSMATSPSDGT
jgi:hypothetical protein